MNNYQWPEHEWKTRTTTIAALVPARSKVVDLGGGMEHLKKYLCDPVSYKSIDVIKCTNDTIVADFNNDEYPDLNEAFDISVAQGIIEYVEKPVEFLQSIQKYAPTLIISYLEMASDDAFTKGRVATYDMRRFQRFLAEAGWDITRRIKHTPNHFIFVCTK